MRSRNALVLVAFTSWLALSGARGARADNGPPGALQIKADIADFSKKQSVIIEPVSFQTKSQIR